MFLSLELLLLSSDETTEVASLHHPSILTEVYSYTGTTHPVDTTNQVSPIPTTANHNFTTKISLMLIQPQGTPRVFRYTSRVCEDHISLYPVTAYMVMAWTECINLRL